LSLLDERAELLVGGAGRELPEQLPDVGLADAAEDAVQDDRERPFAVEDVAPDDNPKHVFGCLVSSFFRSSTAGSLSRPPSFGSWQK
jgi:hypothetical protein